MQLSETTHGRILNEEVPEEAAVDAMIATIIMPNRVDIAPMPEAFLVRAALMRESSRGDDLKTMLYMATNVNLSNDQLQQVVKGIKISSTTFEASFGRVTAILLKHEDTAVYEALIKISALDVGVGTAQPVESYQTAMARALTVTQRN